MIAKIFDGAQEPVVLHEDLKTTFMGAIHPISTPDAPVHQYLGIKYASIPARFRQSKLHTRFPPQVDCTHYGPICPQPKFKSVEEEIFNLTEDCIPDQHLSQSEFECLNLNITCPASATPDSHLPVMFWIHGGGNRGSGSNWIYDAGPLVQKSVQCGRPVIVVSINFRLGLLGFAASPDLLEDNKAAGDEGVGNYGLRDQRKAMEWVHRFIQPFGGNPYNVTLFGESTGAGDIICHLHSAANEAAPVFQRCIVQSAMVDLEVPPVHATGFQVRRLMSTLRVQSVEQMRAVDAEKLVILGPNVRATNDGVFFRKGFAGTLAPQGDGPAGQHMDTGFPSSSKPSHHRLRSKSRPRLMRPSDCHQPVLIGDCGAESLLWSLPASLWTAAGAVKRIQAICQSLHKSNTLLRLYDIGPYTPSDELPDRLLELINDARCAWPTEAIAASLQRARGGHGVWRYVFDQESPSRGVPHHAVDLAYLFDNVPLPALPASAAGAACDYFCMEPRADGGYFSDDSDDESPLPTPPRVERADGAVAYEYDADWALPVVDDWTYARVRDAVQERWLAFAHGDAPWRADRAFVFGPEGEVGERTARIFHARRRTAVWEEALAPLGLPLVQKLGVELCNGPPAEGRPRW